MNVFELRKRLVSDYASYVKSFIAIRDARIRAEVDQGLASGLLWPEPRIGLNPAFAPGAWVDELADQGVLHPECRRIFRAQKGTLEDQGQPLRLHVHQVEAIQAATTGDNYVLTTGTGSGKSLAYLVPIVDHVLRAERRLGIKAIVVYPMNALANSQYGELEKFLCHGYPDGKGPVTFARYTGQESDEQKNAIIAAPPDILLTNYVMLELLLTRVREKALVQAAQGLRFLVFDELHTYRGRQGADVALLTRRVRQACGAPALQCIGTSATMGSAGSLEEQQVEAAKVATILFGAPVSPARVIGETLQRATPPEDTADPGFLAGLRARIAGPTPPKEHPEFIADPLSSWIEGTFGLVVGKGSGRLRRAVPRTISGPGGAAADLAALVGAPESRCTRAIEEQLLAGYGVRHPDTGFPAFAFRLHQFISRGETAYASIEPEGRRHVTLQSQRYVPGDRSRLLFPLVFCRECGQEYYSVRVATVDGAAKLVARPADERDEEEATTPGYLHVSAAEPWPTEPAALVDRLPEEWIEEHQGVSRVRLSRRKDLPQERWVAPDGSFGGPGATVCHFIPAPFRFCLACGVSYGARQRSDFAKLTTLGSEGRSTATTILTLSAIRSLRSDKTLRPEARKLLSFTDNRQDASLQAGHFNDFLEIGLLRSALYRAVVAAGEGGITHEELTQRVFAALDLPLGEYAADPDVRFQALAETQRALRDVLGYRLYLDLRRGWRITSPNLEQCGLLDITYESLDELCAAEDVWADAHPALAGARPATRAGIAKTLLDYMRRELAIKVNYLSAQFQEALIQLSSQRLGPPWALDEDERLERATVLFPRSSRDGDWRGQLYLSPRGGFGQYLRRKATLPGYPDPLKLTDTAVMASQLLECLRVAGLVEVVAEPKGPDDVPGYQVPASAIRWRPGAGTTAFHDPIRVPRPPRQGGRTNPFFRDFYETVAGEGRGIEAREHTAQVPYELREEREQRFREGRLPILFCSPTMELGIDIAELNVVNLRNVPPTPANYAQRSGRAGRSGQPALVFTYCSTGSPHDQWFFRRPELMVAGVVSPPRLDLANEDLVRAHVHAVWLAEAGLSLGSSLKDVLDLSGETPTLDLLPSVQADVDNPHARVRATSSAQQVLDAMAEELAGAKWYGPNWLPDALAGVGLRFEAACERWRGLYRAALSQAKAQQRIILDASRPDADKKQAKRLRLEAEAQLKLLTGDTEHLWQSDFNSYRYFASEGFLPGYSFPRLPLSAFIPGRSSIRGDEGFLARPRFLAISEFGPRSLLYHEGSRYEINRVILPVGDLSDPTAEQAVLTRSAKQCEACGYLHPMAAAAGPDLCERCGTALGPALRSLFRLQNVATRRRDRINSDEEERQRQGYELRTGIRFVEPGGQPSVQVAHVRSKDGLLARLSYGHAALLWRMNLGWRRRKNIAELGFVLDTERGYWAKRPDAAATEESAADPMSARTARVVPYVEDQRNALLVELDGGAEAKVMASLQAALKSAIQVAFQLEDAELAAEPLPSVDDRRLLLLYESAEGGAGVLRRLIDEPGALRRVARAALEVCHFDPDSGADLGHAPGAVADCEAACYDCLMSYRNQLDHPLLDRPLIRELLQSMADAQVEAAPGARSRAEHLEELSRLAGSELERSWLRFLDQGGYRLPSHAQRLIQAAGTRPDFVYEVECAAVYVDGAVHAFAERALRDATQVAALEDLGFAVVRFGHDEDWGQVVAKLPWIFGAGP